MTDSTTTAAPVATPTSSAEVAPAVETAAPTTPTEVVAPKEGTEAAPTPDNYDWVLKKYSGEFEADKLDVKEYAKALSSAHKNLEKRLGKKGAIAPDTVEEYDYKPRYDISNEFKEKAHKEGKLSTDQYKWVMEQYEGLVDQASPTAEKTEVLMKERWGDTYDTNTRAAVRAYEAFVPSHISMDEIGNNPVVLDILANIGASMGEDTSIRKKGVAASSVSAQDVADIMKEGKHNTDKEARATVDKWYAANPGVSLRDALKQS